MPASVCAWRATSIAHMASFRTDRRTTATSASATEIRSPPAASLPVELSHLAQHIGAGDLQDLFEDAEHVVVFGQQRAARRAETLQGVIAPRIGPRPRLTSINDVKFHAVENSSNLN